MFVFGWCLHILLKHHENFTCSSLSGSTWSNQKCNRWQRCIKPQPEVFLPHPLKQRKTRFKKNPKYKRWSSWCLPNGGWYGPVLASDAHSKVWNGPRCCSSAPTQKNNDSHLYFRINPLVVQRFVRGIYEKHSFTHRSNCILGVDCYDFSTQKNLQEEIQSSNYSFPTWHWLWCCISTLLLFILLNRGTTNKAMALTTLHTDPSKAVSWTWSCAGRDEVGKNSSLNHSATSCTAGKQLPKLYQQPEPSLKQTPCTGCMLAPRAPNLHPAGWGHPGLEGVRVLTLTCWKGLG